MIKFEKVSKEEFFKSVVEDEELYEQYPLPKRNSEGSVGYDFFSPVSLSIKPGDRAIIPTGVKAMFPQDVMLMLAIRSSMALKHGVKLINQVAVIDSDYYGDKKNEGHIYVGLENTGEEDYIIKKGDKIVQGMFVPCYFVTGEDDLGKRYGWSYMKEKEER